MSAVSNPLPIRIPEPISPAAPPSKSGAGFPWKWLIVLLVAVGLGWAVYQSLAKKEAQTAAVPAIRIAKVTTGELDRTVRVAGQTSARNFVNVTAPIQRGAEGGREMILMQLVTNVRHVTKGKLETQIAAQP